MGHTTWSYGDVEMYITPEQDQLHVLTHWFMLFAVVAAPLIAAAWSLARFWPTSLGVWVLGTVAFWTVVLATAKDDETDEPALNAH